MTAQMTISPILTVATGHASILVVDDDENTVRLLKFTLERAGARVLSATSGPQALRLTFEHRPDVILLDIRMPEMDGLTFCQRLRDLSDVPIIMITALNGSEYVTGAFAVGADDYVLKPFDTAELLARIQVCLRRVSKAPQAEDNLVLGQGALIIDLCRHSVWVRGTEVHLTRTEFDLLVYMARNRRRVLTHSMLMAAIRGDELVVGHDSLKQFIGTLRRKIELDVRHPQWLLSEHGVGYVLVLD
jgi:two-component system, OmpR family, KDP operon response regulator KdpE